jgi:OOP family OmpA-OmpF porin
MTALGALLLLGSTLSLSAQQGQTWVTVQGGEAFRNDTNVYQNGIAFGVSGGTWFSDCWGLDLKALRTVQPARYLGYPDTHEYLGIGSLLLHVGPRDTHWAPYLALGAGGSRLHAPFAEASTKLNVHAGVGLLGHTDGGFTVQLDAKVVNVATTFGDHFREVLTLAGVGYTWGVRHRTPAPAPAPVVEPEPQPVAPPPPPPPPAPLPPPPPPVVVVVPPPPARIVLDEARLHFTNGKADLDENGRKAIRETAKDLRAYQGSYTVVVTGHTSHTGGLAFNQRLSRERAEAVARVLREEQIPAVEITVVGKGWDEPLDQGTSLEAFARNRRVEIDIKTEDRKVKTNTLEEPVREAAPVKHPKVRRPAKARRVE